MQFFLLLIRNDVQHRIKIGVHQRSCIQCVHECIKTKTLIHSFRMLQLTLIYFPYFKQFIVCQRQFIVYEVKFHFFFKHFGKITVPHELIVVCLLLSSALYMQIFEQTHTKNTFRKDNKWLDIMANKMGVINVQDFKLSVKIN